jgi:glycolate oxidase iron-sulfur subunit
MADADVCCGSAGTYNLTQPEYSDRLLTRKVDAILATGAGAVVSANPGCMLQIQSGLADRGMKTDVLHLVEVLDRAMTSA